MQDQTKVEQRMREELAVLKKAKDDEDDMALLALYQKWFLDGILFARASLSASPALAASFSRPCRWPNMTTMN